MVAKCFGILLDESRIQPKQLGSVSEDDKLAGSILILEAGVFDFSSFKKGIISLLNKNIVLRKRGRNLESNSSDNPAGSEFSNPDNKEAKLSACSLAISSIFDPQGGEYDWAYGVI